MRYAAFQPFLRFTCLHGICVLTLWVACQDPWLVWGGEAGYEVPWVRLLPERPADLESGQWSFGLYSYYSGYKKKVGDYAALGGILSIDIGKGWEFRAFGDVLSWQEPLDVGLGDVSAGVKWNFLKGAFAAALALDLECPSGTREFREAGVEPTLSLISGWDLGKVQPNCTLSTTYVPGGEGEEGYLGMLLSLGCDYSLGDAHSLGIFATGYTPAGASDRTPRVSGGMIYSLIAGPSATWGLTLTRGFSERGMGWSIGLSYVLTFETAPPKDRPPSSDPRP